MVQPQSQVHVMVDNIAVGQRLPSRVIRKTFGPVFASDSGILLREGFLDFIHKIFAAGIGFNILLFCRDGDGIEIVSWIKWRLLDGTSVDELRDVVVKIISSLNDSRAIEGVIAIDESSQWMVYDDMALDFSLFTLDIKCSRSDAIRDLQDSGYFMTRREMVSSMSGDASSSHIPYTKDFLTSFLRNFEDVV